MLEFDCHSFAPQNTKIDGLTPVSTTFRFVRGMVAAAVEGELALTCCSIRNGINIPQVVAIVNGMWFLPPPKGPRQLRSVEPNSFVVTSI